MTTIDLTRFTRVLRWITIGLLIASLGLQLVARFTGHDRIYGFVWLFNVDKELNVPSVFSTLLLLLASQLIELIAVRAWMHHDSLRWHWVVLACGFMLMAADELLALHDKLVPGLRAVVGGIAWIFPAVVVVLAARVYFTRLLNELPRRIRTAFRYAALVYLGGAIGMELIDIHFLDLYGPNSLSYIVLVTIEEGMEMFGAIMFIDALLEYLGEYHGEVRVLFANPRTSGKHRAIPS